MVDSRDSGDAGASGSHPPIPSADDFQGLSDRVAALGQQFAKFISMVTSRFAPPVDTPAPTTTTSTLPTAVSVVQTVLVIVVPVIETIFTPSFTPPSSSSSDDVQLVKDFIRLKPVCFDSQRDFEKIEKWVLSHEKLHRVLRIDNRLQAESLYYTLQRDADI
ncbi:hypothetical protein Scep_016751 [Stephania cephalantha]|uniref:Uncharacterized protein n=1 Tax=Stephania cephalantha TaxID=152367 RepID=A0AAP0NTK6_9MAGN